MKIQPREAERFCDSPKEGVLAVLLYGPDLGLVRERAQRLRESQGVPRDDPFRLASLSGEILRSDPARLADEIGALSFGGGRRVVMLRDATDGLAKLFSGLFKEPPGDALVVVEAGDLGPRGLRKTFEEAPNAAAIACYRDEGAALKTFIVSHLNQAGFRADGEALEYLVDHLGGDRRLTRQELDKLILYVGPESGAAVSLEQVLAVVGDTAERSLDDLVMAVGAGDLAAVERGIRRAQAEGVNAVTLLRGLQRHLQRLHLARGHVAQGLSAGEAVKKLRPPVFWKQQAAFSAQAEAWPIDRLSWALGRVLEAERQSKTTGSPADLLAARACLEIAARAPRRRRPGR